MTKFVICYSYRSRLIAYPMDESRIITAIYSEELNSIDEAESVAKKLLARTETTYSDREGISATIYPLRDGVTYTPSLTKTYSFKESIDDDV